MEIFVKMTKVKDFNRAEKRGASGPTCEFQIQPKSDGLSNTLLRQDTYQKMNLFFSGPYIGNIHFLFYWATNFTNQSNWQIQAE